MEEDTKIQGFPHHGYNHAQMPDNGQAKKTVAREEAQRVSHSHRTVLVVMYEITQEKNQRRCHQQHHQPGFGSACSSNGSNGW